jgi:glycosidase
LLNVYQTLNRLRKENNAIHSGNIEIINTGNKNILAFLRTCEDEKLLVLLNFSKSKITNNISQPIKEVVFSITNKKTFDGILDGFDGVILKI